MDFPFDEELFQEAQRVGRVVWRKHVLEKILSRGISRAWVLDVLKYGEPIKGYQDDKFPVFCCYTFLIKNHYMW